MFCDQTWPTTKNEIIFPRKGRFSFVTGSLGNKRLLTVLMPKAITNKFIRFASRTLPRMMPMKVIYNGSTTCAIIAVLIPAVI